MTVKVKPLVWDEYDRSEPLGLRYLLCDPSQSDDTNGWYVLEEVTNTAIESDGSPEAAKAAAQADYEARILAAIEAPAQEPVAWGESYDGGKTFVSCTVTAGSKHHTFPLYATPADAEAHLTALLRAEYERGVREAVDAVPVEQYYESWMAPMLVAARNRILALLTQEGR